MAVCLALAVPVSASALEVVSEESIAGFKFPESVACDAERQVLYVSEFGSALKPTEKDGQGRISKVSLTGEVMEEQFLPAAGGTLNKPKGLWIQGNRMWVTDIDAVWEFDLESKEGRMVALPGIQFANDPTVIGDTLYVSDNRGDQLYSVQPADFLNAEGNPKVARVVAGKGINPNGVYPARDGSLLMVGFKSKEEPRGIWRMESRSAPMAVSEPIGRLDGIYETESGALLVTDWESGSLFAWTSGSGMQSLASGFTGPADFCAMRDGAELTVVVPDLVKSELRIVRIRP